MPEKWITSIRIHNSSSGPGYCEDLIADKLTIHRSGHIEHVLYNGGSKEILTEEYRYKVNKLRVEKFFKILTSTIKIENWNTDYDGEAYDDHLWFVRIGYSDHTTRTVSGVDVAPPGGDKLRRLIHGLIRYRIKPWIL